MFIYPAIQNNNVLNLDKYNFNFMFEAFDIYTMASQAGKNGRYHAAVAFHEILVKQFEKKNIAATFFSMPFLFCSYEQSEKQKPT